MTQPVGSGSHHTSERMPNDPHTPSDSLSAALDVLRRRWSPAILRVLAERPSHYSALHREIPGISQKVLTQHLRSLEQAGVIHRDPQSDRVRVYYALTERGEALYRAMAALRNWEAR
jgi:DNA-binding HxlR family transcriptional regulator